MNTGRTGSTKTDLSLINHIALVVDGSSSMDHLTSDVTKVADAQVAYLAQRSKELDQETRITVYTFADEVACVVYDKDVLRLPSIAKYYQPYGNTALIDATVLSQNDLSKTAQLYGDHAFLTFVITDGQENASRVHGPGDLTRKLETAPDNWTVAVLVPDARGVHEARRQGFFAGNIVEWDARSAKGVEAAGSVIRQATESFMTGRSKGVRGTRSLFSTGTDALNRNAVKAAGLTPLREGTYQLLNVIGVDEIRPFVEAHGHTYVSGRSYYQLTKREEIQVQKDVAIRNKKSGRVYVGAEARSMLGLPDMTVKVTPDSNPDFQVFVQSTSVNRKLVPGTKLLLLTT